MGNIRVQFGLRVKARREELGYSQRAFAEKLGVSHSYIGDVEVGRRNVTLNTILRLAEGLDTTVGDLMSGL
ncbi:helix-turn-helix domain-containing protein [Raoultibacter phocaeensis]|uniref:helix-turn-helix domain-containing protein n=1 Tax=Raoultibacter phocaeensis TaxID=2479841 RepID=UPI00111815BC|nr:helix-turn-helix transcriptional regulator [Raoultibacter phocaeensis]